MAETIDRNDPRLRRGVDTEPQPQSAAYLVAPAEQRAVPVRPVRREYRHLTCGAVTTMAQGIAETYAASPGFYGATYCVACRMHRPVGAEGEFVWLDDGTKVGT